MQKNTLIGGIAVVALLLSILSVWLWTTVKPTTQVKSQPSFGATSFSTNAPAGNTQLANGTVLPNPSTYDYLVARAYGFLGLLGLDNSTSAATNIGAKRASIVASTTVLCSLTNPNGATSSITHTAIIFTTAPTSTLSLVVGTSSNATGKGAAYSTSSSMETISVGVSATGTVVTWDPGVNNDVIGPNETVNFGVGGASANANQYAPGGSCSGTFVSDN